MDSCAKGGGVGRITSARAFRRLCTASYAGRYYVIQSARVATGFLLRGSRCGRNCYNLRCVTPVAFCGSRCHLEGS